MGQGYGPEEGTYHTVGEGLWNFVARYCRTRNFSLRDRPILEKTEPSPFCRQDTMQVPPRSSYMANLGDRNIGLDHR